MTLFKTIQFMLSLSHYEMVNRFLYYFKKLPWMGKLLPDRSYDSHVIKRILSIFCIIIKMISILFSQAFFCAAVLVLPACLLYSDTGNGEQLMIYILHISVVISLLMGPVLASGAVQPTKDCYIGIQVFKLDGKSCALSKQVYHYTSTLLFLLPCYLFIQWYFLEEPNYLYACMMGLYFLVFHLLGDNLHLFLFERFRIDQFRLWPQLLFFVLLMTLAYLPVYLRWDVYALEQYLFHPLSVIAVLLAGIWAMHYQWKYSSYIEKYRAGFMRNQGFLESEGWMNQIRFEDVKLKEETNTELSASIQEKKGYEYLQAIFFLRHERMLLRPIKKKCWIAVVLISLFMFAIKYIPRLSVNVDQSLLMMMPIMIFIMYSVNDTEKMCRAMFSNCDISLLRYSYYRKPRVLLKNFALRLRMVCRYNLYLSFTICGAVLFMMSVLQIPFTFENYLLFALCVCLLSVLFTVHHLCMYYVFQPFTTEYGMKNPFYSIVNSVTYMVCFLCLQVQSAPSYFVFFVLGGTIVYIAAALWLVRVFAPKYFRVK